MRRQIVTLSLLTTMSIFGFGQSKSDYKVESIFTDLRNLAFSVSTRDLKLKISNDKQIFAVFMETGYPKAAFSLRCMAEGTIGIYFTNGGGIIGIGQHPEARQAGLKLIEMANAYLSKSDIAKSKDLPRIGYTKFYFRTIAGIYTIEEKEEVLGNGKSSLSPLFFLAQDVITKAREIEESKKKS